MVSYQIGKVKYVCLKNEGRESQVIDGCNDNVCSDGIAHRTGYMVAYHKPRSLLKSFHLNIYEIEPPACPLPTVLV
jgi:hypothetical protein